MIHCQLKKMIQVKLKLGLPTACVHYGERNQINTSRLILKKSPLLCRFYLLKRQKNLRWLICITCAVVSIPSESRITRASKRSFGICTSCVRLYIVVSIFKALINVWNEINTLWRRDRLCSYWGRIWQNVEVRRGEGGKGGLNVKIRNDSRTWWYSSVGKKKAGIVNVWSWC